MKSAISKAFTLVELVIIVLLIGILAVIAVSRVGVVSNFRQEGTLTKVRADLRYAKEYAMNNSCHARVAYDTAGDTSYTITTDLSGSWADMEDPTTHVAPFTVTLNTGNYAGVQIASANFDGQTTVEFDAIGRPYSYDGAISTLLAVTGAVTITGGRTVTVTVDTGRVE